LERKLPAWGGRERIDHPVLVSARFDHSGFTQIRQVLGNGHLGELQDILKMTHTKWALPQQVQDA
jgi:hypothetical protein